MGIKIYLHQALVLFNNRIIRRNVKYLISVIAFPAWHLILYALAGIFGILNYVFLHNTMQLVDDNCVLFPRELAFHSIELPVPINSSIDDTPLVSDASAQNIGNDAQIIPAPVASDANGDKNETITKRDVTNSNNTQNDTESENDVRVLSGKLFIFLHTLNRYRELSTE